MRGHCVSPSRRGNGAGFWGLLFLSLACSCASSTRGLGSMSLEEKIGQLFVLAERAVFRNAQSPEDAALLRRAREGSVGGVLWFLSSDVAEASRLSGRLQAAAPTPLLISADLESGVGMRFEGTTSWPWPMAVAATGDPDLAAREGRAIGEEARALGINQVNAPVADVNLDPDNPVINVRSYGEDPERVGQFVAAFVRGVQSQRVLATLKHFPGHGDSRTDSHRALPVLAASRERLEQVELVPFRAGIAAGARAVMTAHLAVPSLDATPAPARPEGPGETPFGRSPEEVTRDGTTPASLSPAITEGLLRGELGFQGLVVTDATDMGALVDHYGPGESAVRAIQAGADQILKSPDLDAAIAAVRRAVETGEISRERLDRSVERILAAKRWAGTPSGDPEAAFRVVDSPAHRALAGEIARRSVTLLREAPGALPISSRARVVQINATDAAERIGADLTRELKGRLAGEPAVFAVDARSSQAEVAAALDAAASADAVLLCLFVRTQAGKGSIALPSALRPALERITALGDRVVVVSFGSPYLLGQLPGAQSALAAYGPQTDVQIAVARALFGEAAITGKLPVTIPGFAARDTGIQKPAREAR